MRSFLGLVNYLNRFSPRLAELSDPLRQICRKSEEFVLNDSVHVPFLLNKRGNFHGHVTLSILSTPIVPPHLQTDASKKGLGAVLLQNSKPVMFTSRALTGSERNYQNLGKGMLSHNLRHGKIPLLPIWKGLYSWRQTKNLLVSIYWKHMVEISPQNPETDCAEVFHTSPLMYSTGKEWKFHWQTPSAE